jgi:N-acetylornithine carbamoyltransferase
VPVINMETIVHPCQEMAHMLTLQERLGDVAGKKYLLTWTWHPKPLNTAVANSALLIATKFGMNVTLLCPSEPYLLDSQFLDAARQNVAEQGGSLTISHDIASAYEGVDVVYAKSWGALPRYGQPDKEWEWRKDLRHFIVDEAKMGRTNRGLFSHCLPLRRNVKATDGVMDADYCVALDEAENRLHVQKAIMSRLAQE